MKCFYIIMPNTDSHHIFSQNFWLWKTIVWDVEWRHHARPEEPHGPALTVENIENLESSFIRGEESLSLCAGPELSLSSRVFCPVPPVTHEGRVYIVRSHRGYRDPGPLKPELVPKSSCESGDGMLGSCVGGGGKHVPLARHADRGGDVDDDSAWSTFFPM